LPVAADYPFLDVLWTMIVIFLWFIWFWILIQVFADLFRRHDISGWAKTAWMIFVILVPFLGVFVYLITQSKGIAERQARDVKTAQAEFDAHVKSVAGSSGAAGEIEKAHALLTSGAITQAEFDEIKRKALATS
jgi:Phospholipase_D-nuclease N-terminal